MPFRSIVPWSIRSIGPRCQAALKLLVPRYGPARKRRGRPCVAARASHSGAPLRIYRLQGEPEFSLETRRHRENRELRVEDGETVFLSSIFNLRSSIFHLCVSVSLWLNFSWEQLLRAIRYRKVQASCRFFRAWASDQCLQLPRARIRGNKGSRQGPVSLSVDNAPIRP